jgi:hypothetical protein
VAQQVEDRKAILIANSDLAVDEAGLHLKGVQGRDYRRIAFGPIVFVPENKAA